MTRRPPRSTRTDTTLSLHDALPNSRCLPKCLVAVGEYDVHIGPVAWMTVPSGAESTFLTISSDMCCQRRSEEHTSELQSLMRISYDVFCLKKTKTHDQTHQHKQLNTQLKAQYFLQIQTQYHQ